jgi:predicted kinase
VKHLFLIRGLPGSGKTTFANLLYAKVYEADDYFWYAGKYRFDADKLSTAHMRCQENVARAMEDGAGRIAVSNTFSQRWELLPYEELAHKHDYVVTEITMSGPLRQNVHGVPDDKIELMRNRWEK